MRGERWKLIWNEEKMKIIMFEMKLIGEGMRERIEKKDRWDEEGKNYESERNESKIW